MLPPGWSHDHVLTIARIQGAGRQATCSCSWKGRQRHGMNKMALAKFDHDVHMVEVARALRAAIAAEG